MAGTELEAEMSGLAGTLTAKAYRIGRTLEALRGHVVELEVVLRDVALSGEASNEDLPTKLVEAAGHVFKTSLHLERACQRLAGIEPRPVRRRPPA